MQSIYAMRFRVRAAACLALGFATIVAGQLAQAAGPVKIEIIADDMCCSGCAKKVAAQLYTAPGVTDVKANVETRTVVVTANPSRNLTLEKLWTAVEKGKGKPSRLVAFGFVYTLTRPADLNPEDQQPKGPYRIDITELRAHKSAERVANVLYSRRGVGKVSVDAVDDALLIEPARGAALSPWMLLAAVEQANEQAVAVTGPHGRLTIESAASAAEVSLRPSIQGETR